MRIGRKVIIPAILALAAAGSIAASSGVATVTAQASATHVVAASASPNTYYHV